MEKEYTKSNFRKNQCHTYSKNFIKKVLELTFYNKPTHSTQLLRLSVTCQGALLLSLYT